MHDSYHHLLQDKGACKTPKRLREILSLLEKMIWRHGKCGYKPLRDKACPSKVILDNYPPEFMITVVLSID
jgi:hypothetical protein